MGTAAAGGSPGSKAMAMASEMDPEETEYLAHLACPTIADDSLAHQGRSDVGQGGRNCCDGLRRTPGMVVPGICPSFPGRDVVDHGSTRFRNSTKWIDRTGLLLPATEHFRNRFRVHRRFFLFFALLSNASTTDTFPIQQITDTHTCVGTLTLLTKKRSDGPVCAKNLPPSHLINTPAPLFADIRHSFLLLLFLLSSSAICVCFHWLRMFFGWLADIVGLC